MCCQDSQSKGRKARYRASLVMAGQDDEADLVERRELVDGRTYWCGRWCHSFEFIKAFGVLDGRLYTMDFIFSLRGDSCINIQYTLLMRLMWLALRCLPRNLAEAYSLTCGSRTSRLVVDIKNTSQQPCYQISPLTWYRAYEDPGVIVIELRRQRHSYMGTA